MQLGELYLRTCGRLHGVKFERVVLGLVLAANDLCCQKVLLVGCTTDQRIHHCHTSNQPAGLCIHVTYLDHPTSLLLALLAAKRAIWSENETRVWVLCKLFFVIFHI